MTLRTAIESVLKAAVVVFLVSMVLGQLLGQPILLGFVSSGSMEPALQANDGFVAIPAAVAGPIEPGDVITFRAKEIQGGGLTTHRVVEITERGYVTKGDNNPFTDQQGGEPPVKAPQVLAVAWQPGGTMLVVPGIGGVITGIQNGLATVQRQLATVLGTGALLGTQGLAVLLVVLSAIGYGTLVLTSGRGQDHTRERTRNSGTNVRFVLAALTGAVVLAATAAMLVPAGPQEIGIISAETDSPGSRIIESGSSESTTYTVENSGVLPVVTYIESATEGVTVHPRELVVPAQGTVNATFTLSAPPEKGYYRRYVVHHRYLLVLPQSMIRSLYGIHPWLPVLVVNVVLGVPVYVVGTVLVGTRRVRRRSRETPTRLSRFRSRVETMIER